MTTAVPSSSRLISADELLKRRDIGRCELLHGELIMMSPAGAEHGEVIARITVHLANYVYTNRLGRVFGAETGFRLDINPDTVRAPDVSFVREDRIAGKVTKKFFDGAPDLAVEVRSPDDTRRAVAEKVNCWLAHGTISVWVADPDTMTITLHRAGQKPVSFGAHETLKDESLLPGFAMPLARVFQLP